jgi:membrane protease YdiL (CAAX protease family)
MGRLWTAIPSTIRAVVAGLAIGLIGANVWTLLILALGYRWWTVLAEAGFLILYLAWASGLGPPRITSAARRTAFRAGPPSRPQWIWGLVAAIAFALTAHAALVILFRLTPFPASAFHRGYDLSSAPDVATRWLVVVMAAVSAGVCEETGFRGYMQQPIERRRGPLLAIAIAAVLFTLVHFNKDWLTVGLTPVVLGAGLLLGMIAWASRSLIFCILGHTLMDVGLFAYWWTQIAGVFTARPIFETGIDAPFCLACGGLLVALTITLWAIRRLAALRASP